MINKIMSLFRFDSGTSDTIEGSRRKHIRQSGIRAEVVLGEHAYSMHDWSMGGVSFETASDALLQKGDQVRVTLKFSLPHDTITIEQQAHIVRAAKRGAAAEFAPLPPTIRRQFERVLDSLHAQGFMESQIALNG